MDTDQKRVNVKAWMYIGICLMLPIIILFKGDIAISLVGIAVIAVLYTVDPIFKAYRKSLASFNAFYLSSLVSGIIFGVISNYYSQYSKELIALWFLYTGIFGFILSFQIHKVKM